MAYDLAKVTANGNNLIAQILANKSSLSIDKIEISDTQLPSTTDISTMTSVPKVVQTVSANGFSKNSNTLIISTVVDNSSIRADYKAWVFGIWGSDSQNGQSQLIAVITSTNSPDTIPAFSGRTPVSYTYKFNIGFSNASQIQFNMIDDSFATNDTVVHTTGDETIAGQKKFKTDPTDSAGNAYAKTVDVNQQLDKKVNVADMRKPASDVVGLEDVNGKLLSSGTDLFMLYNTTGIPQYYYANTNTLASTMLNSPDNRAFTLVSLPLSVSSPKYNATILVFRSMASKQVFYASIGTDGTGANAINYKWTTSVIDNSDGTISANGEQLKPADDSKVVHNSGTEEIAGQKTFDVAPIDKTTGNPYITKDGVPSIPSDVARTGQANTFTAAQTFSIAPTITDASKDKGDNQAATMADLKSVENSAWHQLNNVPLGGTFLYRIDRSSKRIYISYSLDSGVCIKRGT
ncbi:hypothetical protein OQI89_11435, partial [Lentilactobacillus diolivorans]|nr:hypothetical protein [Lentilactobacillus diolivorans]